MAYTAWSVVFGEQPTAAKWNQLGANDAGFKDASNIDNEAITPAKILNRTRRAFFGIRGDGGATATNSNIEGAPEISHSGVAADYTRGHISVPQDYVPGTTAQIVLHTRSTNAQSMTSQHFIGARAVGAAWSSWNLAATVTQSAFAWQANVQQELTISTTIPAANLAAGALIAFAWRPIGTITGTIFVQFAELIYTADS